MSRQNYWIYGGLLLNIALATAYFFPIKNNSGVMFDPSVIDFGLHHDSVPFQVPVKFRNTEDLPIILDSIKSSCGCASPFLTSNRVEAHSESIVGVNFNPQQSPEGYAPVLTLTWHIINSTDVRISQVAMMGGTVSNILYDPSTLTFDGLESAQKTKEFSIAIDRGTAKEPWDNIFVKASFLHDMVVESKDRDHFEVHGQIPLTDMPIGMFKDLIIITPTYHNIDLPYTYSIPIIAKIIGEVKAAPASIYLGVIRDQQIVSGKIEIQPSASSTLLPKLIDIKSDNPEFIRLSVARIAQDAIELHYYVLPTHLEGEVNGKVRVHFSSSRNFELDIPYICFIRHNS